MALAPRDNPITREKVQGWLDEFKSLENPPDIESWIESKVEELNLPDDMVDTAAHEDMADETSVVDMILMDLPSYGY